MLLITCKKHSSYFSYLAAMPISWNEIRQRAIAFSREWADTHNNTKRMEFLIELYEKYTAGLLVGEKKKIK
jgi:hypothetical protein